MGKKLLDEFNQRDFFNKIEKFNKTKFIFKTLNTSNTPLLCYGAGLTTHLFNEYIFKKNNIRIDEFVVDDSYFQEGKLFKGKKIKKLSSTLNEYSNCNIIITFTVKNHKKLIHKLLEHPQVNDVFIMDPPPFFNGQFSTLSHNDILKNLTQYLKTYQLLEDNLSKEVMISFINQRITGLLGHLDNVWTFDDYFPDIFKFYDNEIFIDGGAYDGDSILQFIKNLNNLELSCQSIYAFEPDPENFKRLKLLEKKYEQLICFNKGLSDHHEELYFSSSSNKSSSFSQFGDLKIESISLDQTLINVPITYVKMDIEGFEYKALIGSLNLLKKFKPKLAISLYHKNEDLWQIPLLLKYHIPDYKFYLRIHRPYSQELVLYAIAI